MPATKTVVIYGAGPGTINWVTTPALAADAVARWDAVRTGNGPDKLVFPLNYYECHVDLTQVTSIMVST